ncbi:MAG: LysR family transcriptional regulator [Streptosporangiaceae bacterium]|jgi:DNA-binding transcriptional LysR family regulator
MDLIAVRTFVAVADAGQFQDAADDLDVTQQAVSKRIAALEAGLGVRLFTRGGRRAALTIDGQAFLPHARAVLDAVERAAESVRPGRRALRVDVLNKRTATGSLLKGFHDERPDIELDVVTLPGSEQAMAAVHDGTVDAAFCMLRWPLPEGATSMPAVDDVHELLVGPEHPFANARSVTPRELVGHRIWVPGISVSPDAAAYYAELTAAFWLKIDAAGPSFGMEHVLDMVSESASLATFTSPGMRLMWTLQHDLRRIPVRDPELLVPFSLIWRPDNPHPALAALRQYLERVPQHERHANAWLPSWAVTRPLRSDHADDSRVAP